MSYCIVGNDIRLKHASSDGSAIPGRVYTITEIHVVTSAWATMVRYKLKGLPDLIDADYCERVERG